MIRIPVTIRAAGLPDYETTGWVPTEDCPIAVTLYATCNRSNLKWSDSIHWHLTHRPTGNSIGKRTWNTREEAEAVLLRCDPTFAAWPLATGKADDPATIAVRYKYHNAIGTT